MTLQNDTQFNPKYLQQFHLSDDLPLHGDCRFVSTEDIFDYIIENDVPRPHEYLNDIVSVTYTLAGDVLKFGKRFTYYDVSKLKEAKIRPDLREF